MSHVDTFDAAAAGSATVDPLPPQNTNLFPLDDLDYVSMTRTLAESDLTALQAVAEWIRTFVAKPHKDLGRDGTVCPFVPAARERKTIWLAPERIAKLSGPEIIRLVKDYKKRFTDSQPLNGDDAHYRSIVLVFTDLASDHAKDLFDDVLQHLAVPSYVQDGLVLGAFYERNEATAIHSSSFRPFTPPVPFLLMRPAVISDWKFFLESEDWLDRWARRFGASAIRALADELRQLPWRKGRSSF